jgi:hypothetical protein
MPAITTSCQTFSSNTSWREAGLARSGECRGHRRGVPPATGIFRVDSLVVNTAGGLPAGRATGPACPAQPSALPGVGYGRGRCAYVRRQPEQTVLHRVVREHLETFLEEVRVRGGGEGLPRFAEREPREFLSCGVLARLCALSVWRLPAGDPGRLLVQGAGSVL